MNALTKSCRRLRELEKRVNINEPRSPEYQDALAYRRALYAEFGSKAVRDILGPRRI